MRWGELKVGLVVTALLAVPGLASGASNQLSWTDNSANETGFVIERKAEACPGPAPFVQVGTVAANVTTWTDTVAIVEGGTYCYRVSATNVAGRSAYSNLADCTVVATVPAAPSGLGVVSRP